MIVAAFRNSLVNTPKEASPRCHHPQRHSPPHKGFADEPFDLSISYPMHLQRPTVKMDD
jgi:hypothetical protein